MKSFLFFVAFISLFGFLSYAATTNFIIFNQPINCNTYLWVFTTGCTLQDKYVITNLNISSFVNTTVDYTNVAFINQSNNFTQNNFISNLNISGILYVGNNRSAFPITCSGNQFLSSLGTNGIFVCTTDSDATTDFTNVAFLNNTQTFIGNNTFIGVNATFLNVTSNAWIIGNLNVSGNLTAGNSSIQYLNISNQLFVGNNQSAFPITCSANQFMTALGTTGLFTCMTISQNQYTDFTNVAFLNNTQTFTATNTFQDINVTGKFTVLNKTVWTFINNITVGMLNATDINVSRYFNASILTAYENSFFQKNLNISGNLTAGNVSIDYLNVSSQLFVGQNRSAFPLTCSAGSFLSSLGTSGNLVCTADSDPATDFTNVAFLNNTQTFTSFNTFQDVLVKGWFNVTNATTWSKIGNLSAAQINGTSLNITGASWLNQTNVTDFWAKGNANFSGNVSIGNASIDYLNVTNQLFVGNNRSVFPISRSGTTFLTGLLSTGLWTTANTDYTNVCFLNNTQNFTAQNTFQDLIVLGWFNETNATVFSKLNNVSAGQLNGTSLNISGNAITGNLNVSGFINSTSFGNFGNVNVTGRLNVTNSINTTFSYVQNQPVEVLLFDNETNSTGITGCLPGYAICTLNFTLPSNSFSRIIWEAEFGVQTPTNTAVSYSLDFINETGVVKYFNISVPAQGSGKLTDVALYGSASMQTNTGNVSVGFRLILGSASNTHGIDFFRVYGVSG